MYNPLYNCGWKSVTLFKQQGKTYNNCIDNVPDNNIIIYYYNVYDIHLGLVSGCFMLLYICTIVSVLS